MLLGEHATAQKAFEEIKRLSAQNGADRCASDAIELIVVNAEGDLSPSCWERCTIVVVARRQHRGVARHIRPLDGRQQLCAVR